MARFDLTDADWALIELHVLVAATGLLPRRVRDQFNGMRAKAAGLGRSRGGLSSEIASRPGRASTRRPSASTTIVA